MSVDTPDLVQTKTKAKAALIDIDAKEFFRVDPPFPAVPSFNCSATILSFVNYDDEVKDLLKSLSHNTRNYYTKHMSILEGFVTDVPPLIKQKAFGEMEITTRAADVQDFEFPTRDEAKQMKLRGRKAILDDIYLEPGNRFFRSIQVKLRNKEVKNYIGKYGGNDE